MNLGELFVQIGAIGNSKEVKAFGEAVKKAGKAIDDYDKKLKKASDNGNKTTASIKGTIGAVAGIAAAMGLAYHALDRLTESLAKQNLQWLNLTRQSDIALATFQKWGTIGKIVGVDNAAQQLETLNQKIFNLKLTGEGAKGFQMAGIMPTSADDVLEQLRGRIKNMNNTAATYLLEQMGLDPRMITLLRMGRVEWEKYLDIQRRFTLTDIQRENIDQMNRQLEVAKIQFQYLKDRIVLAMLPAFVRLTKFIESVTESFARMVNWIAKANTPTSRFIKGLLGIAVAIGVIKLALTALSAHPIIASITAIIGAIMLLADDVNHYLTGGGSVIGVIAKGLNSLDLKGFIDFPVPKWLEYMIKFIDFLSGRAADRGYNARLEEMVKTIDPNATKLPNGNFAEIAPVSPQTKSIINNSSKAHTETHNSNVSQQITVYTNADTIKDISQPIYLRAQALGG